ncbi:MAG: DUF4270 family protein [Bacteroidota bacterium]|nr:DUF4270 family protein [Bacteroidota bacterium]
MTKYIYPFFFIVLAGLGLASCQKQPILNFGPNFLPDNNGATIVAVDTSLVSLSTLYLDSTATAGTGYLLVGNYTDSYFGNINSRAFLQVLPPPQPPALQPSDSYDSIVLILQYKKGSPYYGDTTLRQSFMINQVSSLYQLSSFQRGVFSNSSFPISPTSWGSSSALIYPSIPYTSQGIGDSIKIRMPDSLGKLLYRMIQDNSDSIIKPTNWLNWFHGLCISPAPGSTGAIYGFKDSATMRIYYNEASAYTSQKFIDFNITNKSMQFNNIKVDRSNSPMKNLILPTQYLQTPPTTPSALTNNNAYVQSITGSNVKITFPNLNAIAQRPDYIGVLRAQLIVRPVPGSFSTTWRLPPNLNLYVTDLYNSIVTPLPSSTTGGIQNGNLVVDYLNPQNTVYSYDITSFVKAQIVNSSQTASQNGLVLSMPPPDGETTFNRAVLADATYPVSQRVTLIVYYISLYPHQ